ncbi:MAG: hypothetical protein ABH829_01700 [archaeon]
MPLSNNQILGVVISVVVFTLVAHTFYPRLFLFTAFVALGLISKYYKALYAVSFLIVDLTDLFVYLTFYKLGPSYAFMIAPIFAYTYLAMGWAGNEGPTDATARLIGILISTLLLFQLGVMFPPMMAIVIYVTVAGFIWGMLQMLVFHIPNPIYFPIALCRGVLYYKLLPYFMPLLGLG